MTPSPLEAAEQDLRRAIERRHPVDISKFLSLYREIAENHLRSLPAAGVDRLQIFGHILSTLEWARLMLHTHRAIWVEELGTLQCADRFLEPGGATGPRFRLDL